METVELLVKLKIPDVTALTAAGALRRRMGYGRTLRGLRRADYYRLSLDVPDAEAARALAEELAERTNVFVNPNKHVYEVQTAGCAGEVAGGGHQVVQVLVTDPADGSAEGALGALQGRLGYGGTVCGLVRGVLWTLELECPDRGEAERLAREIAVTRRRDAGLLMNPHSQECTLL
jgi:phosphoribosylformylglycinamidine (FGAM) synthase PurS component